MILLILQALILVGAPPAFPAARHTVANLSIEVVDDEPTEADLVRVKDAISVDEKTKAEEVKGEEEEYADLEEWDKPGPLVPMVMEPDNEDEENSLFRSLLAPVEVIEKIPGKALSQHPLLGNGDPEMGVTAVPRNVLTVIMGPVREANFLLPRRLDPFTQKDTRDDIVSDDPNFNPSKQRDLLGSGLSSRKNPNGKESKWSWFLETGGSFRQGNTSNTNLRSAIRTERHTIYSDIMARASVTYNRNGDDDINRQALSELNMDRNLRGRWVGYAREYLEYDQAKLINLRTVTSSGLGFKFINRLTSRLIVRTGPTVSYITYAPEAEQDAEFRSGWLLESDYRRLLWETVRVEWTCSAFPDFDSEQQFRVRNEAALLFPIGGKTSPWNWKLGVQHDYQLNPVENTKPNDVFGYFSIAYTR